MASVQQELVNHYLTKTNQKCTSRVYITYMSSMKSLLNAGYTMQNIIDVIDYLVEHPPRQGFKPAFIQYVIEDTLKKIEVQKIKDIQIFFESPTEEDIKDDNLEKFKSQNKPIIKGGVKF